MHSVQKKEKEEEEEEEKSNLPDCRYDSIVSLLYVFSISKSNNWLKFILKKEDRSKLRRKRIITIIYIRDKRLWNNCNLYASFFTIIGEHNADHKVLGNRGNIINVFF